MNPELPKTVRDALAASAAPNHPSADVLTAFVEHTLQPGERQSVTDHLSRCADCRELVFLTSSLNEEEVAAESYGEQETLPVPAYTALVTGFHARAAESTAPPALPSKPALPAPSPWKARIRWAVSAVAALLVVTLGPLLYQRTLETNQVQQLARNEPVRDQIAAPQVAPATSQPPQATVVAPSPQRSKTPHAAAKPYGPSAESAVKSAQPAQEALALSTDAVSSPVTIAPPPPAVGAPLSGATTQQPALAPAPRPQPPQNSFNAVRTQSAIADSSEQLSLAAPKTQRSLKLSNSTWRITDNGQLEHLVQGSWTRVLAEEQVAFRAVTTIATDVWAGGSGNRLMHSPDNGERWSPVPLPGADTSPNDSIVAIRFENPMNGTVSTQGGLSFATKDGGRTWTRQ